MAPTASTRALAERPSELPRGWAALRFVAARVAAVGSGLLLGFLFCEAGMRLLAPSLGFDELALRQVRALIVAGRGDQFEGRAHILYSRIREREEVNSNGFIGPEWPLERTAGVPRILCLGGSTTEGGNALGYSGSYPFQMQGALERLTGGRVEVFNCGMSGWTSAETTVAWFLQFKDYAPDLIVLHHSINDAAPRMFPGFRSDYSHYRKTWEVPAHAAVVKWLVARSVLAAWALSFEAPRTIDDLVVQHLQDLPGTPGFDGKKFVNDSAGAFRRNLLSIAGDASASGTGVALATMPYSPLLVEQQLPSVHGFLEGMQEHNQIMRELAAEHGYLLIDLEREFLARPRAEIDPLFLDLAHLTPEGNALKAQLVVDAFWGQWEASAKANAAKASADGSASKH